MVDTGGRRMRHLLGVAGACVLVLMLSGTTPFGTDDAAHRDVLLHPIFPHLHLVDGRLVLHWPHPPRPSLVEPRPAGVTVGAASGAQAAAAGLGLTPPLPGVLPVELPVNNPTRLRPEDQPLPLGRAEAPPDPPPTRRACVIPPLI
jgi:hypothetical protein